MTGDDDGVDAPDEDDVFTGEMLDALFEVETSGEVEPDHTADESEAAPVDDAVYSIDEQIGEDLPPELRPPGRDEPDLALDPTDPGYTSEDLTDDDLAVDGEGELPFESSEADSVPTSDWLIGDWRHRDDDESPEGVPAPAGAMIGDSPAPDDPTTDDAPSVDVPAVAAAGLPGVDDTANVDAEPPDWAAFTDETKRVTSTQEYAGLAQELARDEGTVTEQSAVAAGMPGLESGLVGLEDVVGATDTAPVVSDPQPDLALRALTGIGLLGLFLVTLLWPLAIGALAALVFVAAAGEFYAVLRANGYRPLAVFGLAGVLGALLGTWAWGLGAVPVAMLATLVAIALQQAMATPRQNPLQDTSLTMLGAVWIGGLGSFAFPIIVSDGYRWLILAAVLIIIALDIGQYFVGRRIGRRPMAPVVSPKKTVEGLIGGAVTTILVAVALSFVAPIDLVPLLIIAAAAIVLGPLGDLSVSLVKRILGVKDMGTVLPGHGGILDRIDGLLFVLPAVWLVYEAAGLLT